MALAHSATGPPSVPFMPSPARTAGPRRRRIAGGRLTRLALLATITAPVPAAAASPLDDHRREGHRVDVVERPDLAQAFADAGTTGTLVVEQHGRLNRRVVVGAERSHLRILPSSTFKIPNSLIAIDARVVSGPEQSFPGPNPNYVVDGKPLLPAACEDDLTLQTAFTNSCIPIYRQIAREVGVHRYARAVRAYRYGNGDVTGAAVDDFWLHGPFAISAQEQVDFLERLRKHRLPASRRAINDVREMLITGREGTNGTTIVRGKTGYVFAQDGQPRRGWWVGSVERPGQTSTFALNLDMVDDALIPARVTIGRQLLTQLGAFEPATAAG